MGVPPIIYYQNPTVTDNAVLDTTLIDPGPSSGIPTIRENLQVWQTPDIRHEQEMQTCYLDDESSLLMMRKHVEKFTPTDRRGGTGRGSTR